MNLINTHQAIQSLSQGKVVILPFEGHYILACLAMNINAVNQLLQDKQKKATQPLSVLLPDLQALKSIHIQHPLLTIAQQLWPAPLTVTIPAFPGLPSEVSGLTQMINLQIPSHPIVAEIITQLNQPLLISSANAIHQTPAKTVADCIRYGFEHAHELVEGEPSEKPSTLIGYTENGFTIKECGALDPSLILPFYKGFGFAG
jgi:L-threonylcarbamoyladenylate synthase